MVAETALRDAIGEIAALALCRQSFPDFLRYCSIRSDDPHRPGSIPLVPWPFQVERAEAWESGSSEVILKERQMGFSQALVAPYILWRAMYHGWACGYWSVDQQASRTEMSRIRAMWEDLPDWLKFPATIRVDDAEFHGGGSIRSFASTEHAGISYTLQLAVMDEAAFHPYGASNYAAFQPAVARGQVIILSTADPSLGPSGFMFDMYWRSKRGETPYRAVFVARCRPDRDEAWYARARSAYAGNAAEFDAYYPETDAGAFVGRSGLVYPMFSEQQHVWVPSVAGREHPWRWEDSVRHVCGGDFGGGDPTAFLPHGLSGTHKIHQFGEFYRRGPVGVYDIASYLGQWPARNGIVVCDPSEPVAIETLDQALRGTGWRAKAADNRRGEGLGLVAEQLSEPGRYTIHASCTESIAEFPGYRWTERTDPNDKTRYATRTPVDHHADGHDARRYAVMELLWMLRNLTTLPTRALNGAPLARKAR